MMNVNFLLYKDVRVMLCNNSAGLKSLLLDATTLPS